MNFKVTIQESKWLNGSLPKNQRSFLRNPKNQKMCCLGFFSAQKGVPLEELNLVGTPDELPEHNMCDLKMMVNQDPDGYYDTKFTTKAIEINDARSLDSLIDLAEYENIKIPKELSFSEADYFKKPKEIQNKIKEIRKVLLTKWFKRYRVDLEFIP